MPACNLMKISVTNYVHSQNVRIYMEFNIYVYYYYLQRITLLNASYT